MANVICEVDSFRVMRKKIPVLTSLAMNRNQDQ